MNIEGSSQHAARFERLDALRGIAMVWMAAFHFSYDLNHFGYIKQDFYTDPRWTLQRTGILSLFLFCAGISLALGLAQRQGWWRFGRRWLQVLACALLVSTGSYLMFPNSFIYFGVLHGMAAMLLLVRLMAPLRAALWPVGLLLILLPHFVQHPWFDTVWTNWLGLVTHLPVTQDYVPLLPWMGVMCWGLASGQLVMRVMPTLLTTPVPSLMQPLVVLGRWSLSFYMVHKPFFIGLLTGAAAVTTR